MDYTELPDRDYLLSRLDYDPHTGIFIWKLDGTKSWHARANGKQAGLILNCGHRQITLHGKRYLAHRLAWLIVTGESPMSDIDHKDRNPDNNRWSNLRLATVQQNAFNRNDYPTSQIGARGISSKKGKYQAVIGVGGKDIYLGRFQTLEEAKAVRAAAEVHYFGEFANV